MGFGEKIARQDETYYRGRFKIAGRKFGVVRNRDGSVRKFATRKEATDAARLEEAAVKSPGWRDPASGLLRFADWASEWYAELDLAGATMANYRLHLENHLIPAFGDLPLAQIAPAHITAWQREEKRAGYAESSIRTWRATLHAVLDDAVPGKISVNPAAHKRGKGKRSARKSSRRGPEKVITTPLGALLIAERMSVLSGRDDELVMILACYWHGLRLAELVGLETEWVRRDNVRAEWQLYDLEGTLVRQPPKDGSFGNMDTPRFLRPILAAHIARTRPAPCPCHGKAYVFRGMGRPRGKRGAMTVRHVAALAGVSPATVSAVVNGRRVTAVTREQVQQVIDRTGWEPNRAPDSPAWHWRRSSFEDLFDAAATGYLPARDGQPRRPVPLYGDGTRVRGRNAQGRAEACWAPVAPGLTPHGLRHSHRTWLEEQRVPEVLAEQRLRHDIPGVSGVYRHVTEAMRAGLLEVMEDAWNEALGARLEMSPHSPVPVLGGLLQARAQATGWGADSPKVTRLSPVPAPGAPVQGSVSAGRGGRI